MVERPVNLRRITPAERNRLIGRALEMKAAKFQVQEIADELGVDRRTVTYWTNPKSREKTKERSLAKNRNARNGAKRRERPHNNNVGHTVIKGPSEADYLARLLEVHPDDRSLTGRICGDPPSGRSALASLTK